MEMLNLGAASARFRRGLTTRRQTGEGLLERHRLKAPEWGQCQEVIDRRDRLRLANMTTLFDLEKAVEGTRRWHLSINRWVADHVGSPERYQLKAPPAPLRSTQEAPMAWVNWNETMLTMGLGHIEVLREASGTVLPREVRQPEYRFEEVRSTGLIHGTQLSGYVARMAPMRTKVQISEAIGAAKELTEACYIAAGEMLHMVNLPTDDFPKLGKTVRRELFERESLHLTKKAQRAMTQMGSGLGTVDDALAAVRNELGTGHGRVHPPAGLKRHHGQLAIDAAEMQTRFVVNALVGLGLLCT